MAKNVTVAGVSYTDVPAVELPLTAGGTAEFYDLSDAEGEVVSSGSLVSQGVSTYTSNGTYDTTTISSVTVNVSGGGGSDYWYGVVNNTISEAIDSAGSFTSIGDYAFAYCSSLTTASFPAVTGIGGSAFLSCTRLTTVSFPVVTNIENNAFQSCTRLTTVSFPMATSIGSFAFQRCTNLTTASFPMATSIGASEFVGCYALSTAIFSKSIATTGSIFSYAFRSCYNLLSLYLLGRSMYQLPNYSTPFGSTPISNYTTSTGGVYGSIFVPASLYSTYLASANWARFSARFVSLTDEEVQNVLDYGGHDLTS
ncbi:MAG: leucine-rich repeat domain-containing protein [Lachnospiraceae bacterium]|nr:leucine-rich repeat domain-containing protein [Lachnospiraceae bacterium]